MTPKSGRKASHEIGGRNAPAGEERRLPGGLGEKDRKSVHHLGTRRPGRADERRPPLTVRRVDDQQPGLQKGDVAGSGSSAERPRGVALKRMRGETEERSFEMKETPSEAATSRPCCSGRL